MIVLVNCIFEKLVNCNKSISGSLLRCDAYLHHVLYCKQYRCNSAHKECDHIIPKLPQTFLLFLY